MATKKDIELRKNLNRQLREECLAGYTVALDHPISVKAQELAVNILMKEAEGVAWLDLSNQLGRSLISIGANFNEALGRSGVTEKLRFLRIARGSAYESIFHARVLYTEPPVEIITLVNLLDAYIVGMIPQEDEMIEE